MASFDTAALEEFYARISAANGVEIGDLLGELADLFERPRSQADIDAYRLSRSPWKKLADEVGPICCFFEWQGITTGRVRFPLDDKVPDAWLQPATGGAWTGIEVTIAAARERYHLATEMIRDGIGRGFIGVPDDAPQHRFDAAMSRRRIMYSTAQALSACRAAIERCLTRKIDPKFGGYILVIQAPLWGLASERWELIKNELREAAAPLAFGEVYVVSNASQQPWGFQIK
jgi:hypothetical protein